MSRTEPPRLKRAYDPPAGDDGTRVLTERLWPRGLSKDEAAIDRWAKELAPSPSLRKWYGHDPAKWDDFRARYRAELAGHGSALDELAALCRAGRVTLVYASRDTERNSTVVLRDVLVERMGIGKTHGAVSR